MSMNAVVTAILATGVIDDQKVLELRKAFYADNSISEEEADSLFALNDRCTINGKQWGWFFVDAISDYLINQVEPEGYVDEANAKWLISRINADGKVETVNELELLISLIEKAKSVPSELSCYALDQVKHAVIDGSGLTRSGKSLSPGCVTEADVDILRRILYAYGSGGNIGVTAEEAEVLFDINDAAAGAENHVSWPVLFSQAIANHLMMAGGHAALSREDALRDEEWLNDDKPHALDFVAMMISSLRQIYQSVFAMETDEQRARRKNLATDKAIADSERITSSEAHWLAERINRDGQLSPAEEAVLSFIKHESPDIDPALKPLLDKVA